jgi:hypothetical protein
MTRRYWVVIGKMNPGPGVASDGARAATSGFGVVHVDFETQQRTPEASFGWYRDLIAARRRSPRAFMQGIGCESRAGVRCGPG